MISWVHLSTAQTTHGKDKMGEPLTIIASIWTIWAQSSILAENGEFERFNREQPVIEQPVEDYNKRRNEILAKSIKRRNQILANNEIVLSQTRLNQ